MVEDIFQRCNTTLNGYEQSISDQQTTITISSYHSHKSIHISIDNQTQPSMITASERIIKDGGRFTPTYTALTLRGARGPEAGIITLLLA
jgi:hypothetical protein